MASRAAILQPRLHARGHMRAAGRAHEWERARKQARALASGRRGDEEAEAEVSAVAQGDGALHGFGENYSEPVSIPA